MSRCLFPLCSPFKFLRAASVISLLFNFHQHGADKVWEVDYAARDSCLLGVDDSGVRPHPSAVGVRFVAQRMSHRNPFEIGSTAFDLQLSRLE
ncbi:hypothetical protein Tco_0973615 [Tanacetum coccineum]